VRILEPLPVSKIWGVGEVTEKRLHELGLRTIGDIQRISVDELRELIGNTAEHLHALAMGEDAREVETENETKSISSEHTFNEDTADLDQIKRCLLEQCEEVGGRLRREQLAARTVQLKLRYADFTTLTRRKTLATPTQSEIMFYQVAVRLLTAEPIKGKRIRLIGISGMNLVPPEFQSDLFDQMSQKHSRLERAIDDLRAKLGHKVIKRGSSLS
jgi:DNA polymerase-4